MKQVPADEILSEVKRKPKEPEFTVSAVEGLPQLQKL